MRRDFVFPINLSRGGSGPLMSRTTFGFFPPSTPPSASSMPMTPSIFSGKGVTVPDDAETAIGVLHKWVNIRRGWKPRLFILNQGVLSYYRLDGATKAYVVKLLQKLPETRCIGEEMQRMGLNPSGENGTHSTPLGEVHLQVSTLRASETDDKKFYVFSGTTTLHLRADSKEERQTWLDTLQGVKEYFSVNPEVPELPPAEPVKVSTLPLRSLLAASGVTEAVITECERLVEADICAPLLASLKQERSNKRRLMVKLRQLEVDKQELETQVVQESLYQAGELTQQQGSKQSSGGLETEEDWEGSEGKNGNEEGDEEAGEGRERERREEGEELEFFEAAEDFFSPSPSSSFRRLSSSLPDPTLENRDPNPNPVLFRPLPGGRNPPLDMDLVGLSYPVVKRRQKLPEPAQKEQPVGLWGIIKDNVGKDLSHVCLPVYFNEPISTLQKCFEEMEYSALADKAAEWGNRGDRVMRALHVAAFAMSAYSCTAGRSNKPFNPLLGETFEAVWEDKGLRFIAEKVSHHPNVVAFHCEGQGWAFSADSNLKVKFWGPSITLEPTGVLSLTFDDGETYEWTKVTTGIYNIILGKPYVDHYGTMKINGSHGLSIVANFRQPSMIDRHQHQVRGYVRDDVTGEKLATIIGKWDQSLHYVKRDLSKKHLSADYLNALPDAVEIWTKSPPSDFPTRYNLTSFAITLNEITPGLQEWLPPTDSRLRPDQRALENGIYDYANEKKQILEQRQRQNAKKVQESGWKPKWFKQQGPNGSWRYQGNYWERRAVKDWSGIPNIYKLDEVAPAGKDATKEASVLQKL